MRRIRRFSRNCINGPVVGARSVMAIAAVCALALAFAPPAPHLGLARPFTPRARPHLNPQMFDDMAQRLESGKAAAIGALSGAVAGAPFAYVAAAGRVAQWEFDVDMLSLSCALFAITYRYAVREDDNPMLRLGVVGAFAIVRALPTVRVSDGCTPVPLRCPPYGLYVDPTMALQGLGALVVGACAFGVVSIAIDQATARGWLLPSPASTDSTADGDRAD
mmetsp:Transcript_22301/g.75053  ORF Transcript_22301/g.75053 Transcript_22301/m.75053 type:complete len:220 (+) Transcript_22301:1419-2078(+)